MDKALYIGMTGAKNNMLGQSIHANNLANANTTGFRSDFEQARSMPVYYGPGHPTRAYALTENPSSDFTQGPLIETGSELDFAVLGDGFLAVLGADGTEAYTRAASLTQGPNGELLTANGLQVMGEAGPIFMPPSSKIDIGLDGTVTSRGATPLDLVQPDRIRLVNPNVEDLEKGEDGLFRLKDGTQAAIDGAIRLSPGFLEGSNVNPINEFVDVISLSRQYELNTKIMSTAKANSEVSAELLRNS